MDVTINEEIPEVMKRFLAYITNKLVNHEPKCDNSVIVAIKNELELDGVIFDIERDFERDSFNFTFKSNVGSDIDENKVYLIIEDFLDRKKYELN